MPDPHYAARATWTEPADSPLTQLAGALAGVPRLQGAICRHSTQWDADHDDAREEPAVRAARLARSMQACLTRCPALSACAAWLDGLESHQRPSGVVAGQIVATGKRPPQSRLERKGVPLGPYPTEVARAWLTNHLRDFEPHPVADIKHAGWAEAELTPNQLNRAAHLLGVLRTGLPRGGGGRCWQLTAEAGAHHTTDTPNVADEATQPQECTPKESAC